MVLGKSSGSRLLFYLIYALLITSALLVVRFPTEKFLRYAEKKVEAALPGSKVKLSTMSYAFPLSVHLGRAQMSGLDNDEDILLLQQVQITPKLDGLGFVYHVSGSVLGGSFATELKIAPADKRYSLKTLELTGIDLSRSAPLSRIFRRDIQGVLKFSGEYSNSFDASVGSGTGMAGEGVLRITNGSFALRQSVLTLKTLDFDSLDTVVMMQDGVLTLNEGVLEGKELQANFTGNLVVANTPQSWKLDLAGGMVPNKDFLQEKPQMVSVVNRLRKQYKKNDLPYTVSGTLANPSFRFGGTN
ncbi:type II secretion system protein GspN [Desulfosediminicola sp.]|uniref:type II secretion system protein GspN n=1 Tax=Desulfosediminicola sp. TaxID=2886825 RepID=UPI003AF2CEC7